MSPALLELWKEIRDEHYLTLAENWYLAPDGVYMAHWRRPYFTSHAAARAWIAERADEGSEFHRKVIQYLVATELSK
jgi:hypothetical protein